MSITHESATPTVLIGDAARAAAGRCDSRGGTERVGVPA
jgi:hypothetical protein